MASEVLDLPLSGWQVTKWSDTEAKFQDSKITLLLDLVNLEIQLFTEIVNVEDAIHNKARLVSKEQPLPMIDVTIHVDEVDSLIEFLGIALSNV